jgi:hypothetical protein
MHKNSQQAIAEESRDKKGTTQQHRRNNSTKIINKIFECKWPLIT